MNSKEHLDVGAVAEAWWRRLVPSDDGTRPPEGWQRAALARLRRATTHLDVMTETHALRLFQELPRYPEDRVAVLAGVLAVVRKNGHHPITRVLGREELDKAESATLSESRFRRLLQTPDHELLDPMRRLVRLAKGAANVRHLAASILYWGDGKKKQWVFEYYGASSASRSSSPPDQAATGAHLTPQGDTQ